ncbi:hypothetical protein [Desulfococcus sp.]
MHTIYNNFRTYWVAWTAFHAGNRGSNPLGDAILDNYMIPFAIAA